MEGEILVRYGGIVVGYNGGNLSGSGVCSVAMSSRFSTTILRSTARSVFKLTLKSRSEYRCTAHTMTLLHFIKQLMQSISPPDEKPQEFILTPTPQSQLAVGRITSMDQCLKLLELVAEPKIYRELLKISRSVKNLNLRGPKSLMVSFRDVISHILPLCSLFVLFTFDSSNSPKFISEFPASRIRKRSRTPPTVIERLYGTVRDLDSVQERESSEPGKCLPMSVNGEVIRAQPDTGAEGGNFMDLNLVNRLNLHIKTKKSDLKIFELANGKKFRALGRVKLKTSFAEEAQKTMTCWFYVFKKLSTSLIMGHEFLMKTKTISKYTYRLVERVSCLSMLPRVNLISSTNQAKRRLSTFVDGRPTNIHADSGSDLDLISHAYAIKHGYKIDRRIECRKQVQYADGSTAQTIGQVEATVTMRDGRR